ncbi:MAG: PAS domain-containing protein, partial [Planctomycetes bacterium]|nr:PAS domain-containing protein [Planctomycetota bacterium]
MERYPPGHLADRENPDPQALDLERVLASSSRRRRQALLAVIIGACTIITCCLVGYWAYRTSREVLFRRVARENLTIAHTVANYIAEQPAAGDEDATNRALEQVRSFWHRFNHHASAAFLCVVKPNGEMVVCTANPSMEGSIVSDLALARPTPRGGTTISDLLAGKRDFWGENVILTGQQQVVGFCYSRILDCGVMVHLPTALVEEEVAAASRPWGGGIAVVAFLLIPLSLGLMHRSYSSAQRAADHATASLVASEAKYCDLYDNAPDMYASVNAQSARIEQCNETLARRLGYSKTEIIGRLIFDLYHPQSKEGAKRAFKDFVEAGEVHNAELRLECNDGSPLDVSLNVSSVRDANGKILHSR